MSKEKIKDIIEKRLREEDQAEFGVKGVQFFKVTEALHCAPAVYAPTVVAIVNGTKEAILDGVSYEYDNDHYMCCSMSMPVEAGTPKSSKKEPLVGVIITLDTRLMTEIAIEMESVAGVIRKPNGKPIPQGLSLSQWDNGFTEALLRLVQLSENPEEAEVLGEGRLRELYYAVLKGDAGPSVRRAFGVGNEIARSIVYLSDHLDQAITIDDMSAQVGMSKAVFHRKFKQATTMSPIQFAKSMRLNTAAMKMADGMNVSEAAAEVCYISTSQFSREFKRMYGLSPKQWSGSKLAPAEANRKATQFFEQLQHIS